MWDILRRDGFLLSMNVQALAPASCREGFAQSGQAEGGSTGCHWGVMVRASACKRTHPAAGYMWPQASGQLAVRAATDGSSSASPGVLRVGQGLDQEKATIKGLARLAPRPNAEWHLRRWLTAAALELAHSVVAVCGPHHCHAACSGGWCVLAGGGEHDQRPNRRAAPVSPAGRLERVCSRCVWAAPGGHPAASGQLPSAGGC